MFYYDLQRWILKPWNYFLSDHSGVNALLCFSISCCDKMGFAPYEASCLIGRLQSSGKYNLRCWCLFWPLKPFPLVHCSAVLLFGEERRRVMISYNHASTLLVWGLGAERSGLRGEWRGGSNSVSRSVYSATIRTAWKTLNKVRVGGPLIPGFCCSSGAFLPII